MAFVNGSTFIRGGGGTRFTTTCSRKAVAQNARTAPVRMAYSRENGNTIVTRRDMELEEVRRGFTFHSENWNGRAAMLGFMIMLATEVINPAHPTIIQQIGGLFLQF